MERSLDSSTPNGKLLTKNLMTLMAFNDRFFEKQSVNSLYSMPLL